MYSTGAFNPVPMGFQYPGQQPPPSSIYQSQYAGFNPQVPPSFQQVTTTSTRGQSVPASNRQYPPPSGSYAPTSSRRHGQYPPTVPLHHHERRRHESKSKKHSKRRSISPPGVADESLYSDKEKDNGNRSHSSILESTTKQEESTNNDQEPQSQTIENASGDISQGGTNVTDEPQKSEGKRRSRSKKKKHHHHHPEYYNQYQTSLPPSLYGELSSHIRVHQQPLYSGYNQAYDESVRRGDVHHKHGKRLPRFPPETKQKLLPHEDDRQKTYQYSGYTQPVFPGVQPPLNPYQPGFYPPPPPPTTPYNIPHRWTNVGGIHGQAEQEIQRLRSHIHTLEGELNKLQKKLKKTTLNNRDENHQTHQRSKHEELDSPRQTPVIVELNNTNNEKNQESLSKKKHRHRKKTPSNTQQGQNLVQQLGENNIEQNTSNQQQTDSHQNLHSDANQIPETENKPVPKTSREETAAQLAHAAAAHVHARQQVPIPPTIQQQQQQGGLPSQNQQHRGQPIRFPATGNIYYPNDPYQQRHFPNSNFNQSNNNELFDRDEERRNRRSADKILDAFERVYMNKSSTPMKVKYIPEDNNSNRHQQRNTNNNNNNQDRSRSQSSSSSSSSSSSNWLDWN